MSAPSSHLRKLSTRRPDPVSLALRDYQHEALAAIDAEAVNGHRRILLVAPTGAGKTVMIAAAVADARARGERVLVLAHRAELIEQARDKITDGGGLGGIPASDVAVYRGKANRATDSGYMTAPVVIASMQTVADLAALGLKFDLVIVDEAHHCLAKTYMDLLTMWPDARHLGATATPWWGKGKGLGGAGGYFQAIVIATTTRWLTEAGFLVWSRVFTHEHDMHDIGVQLRGVKAGTDGEYQKKSLGKQMNVPHLRGNILKHWQERAEGRSTILFGSSLKHIEDICGEMVEAGIKAVCITGEMDPDERLRILGTPAREGRPAVPGAFERGEITVLLNYDVLTEGYDAPWVGCVVLARPTRFVRVYVQAVGRGLRGREGKENVIVLDHAGLCLAFGLPEADRPCTLEGLEKQGAKRGEGKGAESEDGDCCEGEKPTDATGVGRDGKMPVRKCQCGWMGDRSVAECEVCAAKGIHSPMEEPEGELVEFVREGFAEKDLMLLTYRGREQTIAAWAAETGIDGTVIRSRLRLGWNIDRIFDELSDPTTLTYNGETKTISQWAKKIGITNSAFRRRLRLDISEVEKFAASARKGKLNYGGESLSIIQWAEKLGISESGIRDRVRRRLPIEQILAVETLPRSGIATLTHGGRTMTITEWAAALGVHRGTLQLRLAGGLPIEQVLAPAMSPSEAAKKSNSARARRVKP